MKRILLVEPFFSGSHAAWARGLKQHSQYEIRLLTLKGQFWKWRMHGGAVTLARRYLADSYQPDLILASDMLDLSTFLGLTRRRTANIPVVLYFHENQLTYPWSPEDQDPARHRDRHYGFINVTSALAADQVWFNSAFHKEAFLTALPDFLQAYPDHQERNAVALIHAKSKVMPLGLNLSPLLELSRSQTASAPHTLLWNHRWEYDKGPEAFFEILFQLQREGLPFQLVVLGENYQRQPAIFEEAKARLKRHIVHWGYVEANAYQDLLAQADILPVTATHDFFGASVVEAIAAGLLPLLPNRLAYPEHISSEWQAQCVYHSESELLSKLRELLGQGTLPDTQPLRDSIQQYDWKSLVLQYEGGFEALITSR